MDDSSASTSADPLTLPSSPLGRHVSPRKMSVRPLRSRSPVKQRFSSPAKSFIMDTGDGGNEQSPWRIKVTVQAEPRDGESPAKNMGGKTMTVPLKGGSSSPVKRPARRKKAVAQAEESEMEVEIKRPQRKRKGTPMRRVAKRPSPAKLAQEDEDSVAVQDENEVAVESSPTKKPAKKRGRRSLGTMPIQRGQRLSRARDELDEALQEAVGGSDEVEEDEDGMHGDMTAMNEDFTMISVETLQSMKQNTSMLEDSQIGDKSAVTGSYWPSSPPETQKSAKRSTEKRDSGKKADYPNISAQAQHARDTPAKSFVQAFDAMSWKPTGRAVQEPTPAESSELQRSSGKKKAVSMEEQWHGERQQVSQQIQSAPTEDVHIVEDEQETGLGAEDSDENRDGGEERAGEDDIWAEEASRSLEEDVDSSHLSRRSRNQRQAEQQPNTAEQLNSLFSGMSSKPPRTKIPRTWRRSSGNDFTYSDSPAHSFARDEHEQQRKASGNSGSDGEGDEAERGSGVLTPPSTDEDDEHADNMEDGDGEDGKSAFEPDAVATELQVRDVGNSDSESEEDEASDESNVSPDGEDTGLFWQSNLPNVYKRPVRPRLAGQRKSKDLSSLLKDDESSRIEKQSSPKASMLPPPQPSKRFPGSSRLAARREAASSSFTSTSSGEQAQVVKEKEKVVSSPLRKSLLRSSKLGGPVTGGKAATSGAGGRESNVKATSSTQQETTEASIGNISMSFASKASDQRQLLEETIAVAQPKLLEETIAVAQRELLEETIAVAQPKRPQRRVGTHVEVSHEDEEESLWQAAGKEEEEDAMEEAANSPAQSVNYSGNDEDVQYTDDYDSEEEEEQAEYGEEEEELEAGLSERMGDTTRSYEEHLNVSSPQKIRVNFGDSGTVNHSNTSLLETKRSYPPLFGSPQQEAQRPASRGHQLSFPAPQADAGLLTKLSSTFWSAVTRPVPVEPVFPAYLQAQLRSRYGVLSNAHPWAMAHMRTLHRMLNSSTTGKRDSLVPAAIADLPSTLLPLVGRKIKDPIGRPFIFTAEYGQVVWAFLQLLVSPDLVRQIEQGEIDFIGDSLAERCRGYYDEYNGKARHGEDLVFAEGEVVKPRPVAGEGIRGEWVARCVGACVRAQRKFEEGL